MNGHLQLEIKREDIRQGEKCHPNACPIARSFKRVFPSLSVSVGRTCIAVYETIEEGRAGGFIRYEIPVEVERQIDLFDRTGRMEPFSFTARALAHDEKGRICEEVPNVGTYALI